MTDEQKAKLKELQDQAAKEEKELADAEAAKEAAEKEKRAALAAGDKKGAREAQEIVSASESSVTNLSERLDKMDATIMAFIDANGTPAQKEKVAQARMRFLRKS